MEGEHNSKKQGAVERVVAEQRRRCLRASCAAMQRCDAPRPSRRSLGVSGAVALAMTLMACGDAKTAAIVPSPTTHGSAPSAGAASATTTRPGTADPAAARTSTSTTLDPSAAPVPSAANSRPAGPNTSEAQPTPPSLGTVPVPINVPRTSPRPAVPGGPSTATLPTTAGAPQIEQTEPTGQSPSSATTAATAPTSTSAADKPATPNPGPTDPRDTGSGSNGKFNPSVTFPFPSFATAGPGGGPGPSNFPLDDIIKHLVERDYAGALELIAQVRASTPAEHEQLVDLAAVVQAMADGNAGLLAEAARIVDTPGSPIAAFIKVAIGVYQGKQVDVAIDQLVPLLPANVITAIVAQVPSNQIANTHIQLGSGQYTPNANVIASGIDLSAPIVIDGIDGIAVAAR